MSQNEEVERIKRELESRRPAWEHKEKIIREINRSASETIKMLESRVKTASFEVDLGDGTKVGIRSNLSIDEVNRMQEILSSRGEIVKDIKSIDPAEKDAVDKIQAYNEIFDDLWLELIEMITVDPEITFKWLKNNSDLYSKEDTLVMYLAYKEGQSRIADERKEKIEKAISFRVNPTG